MDPPLLSYIWKLQIYVYAIVMKFSLRLKNKNKEMKKNLNLQARPDRSNNLLLLELKNWLVGCLKIWSKINCCLILKTSLNSHCLKNPEILLDLLILARDILLRQSRLAKFYQDFAAKATVLVTTTELEIFYQILLQKPYF